jgi:hypothetical protein
VCFNCGENLELRNLKSRKKLYIIYVEFGQHHKKELKMIVINLGTLHHNSAVCIIITRLIIKILCNYAQSFKADSVKKESLFKLHQDLWN